MVTEKDMVISCLTYYNRICIKGILAIKKMLASTEYDLLKHLGKVMFRCIEKGINVQQLQELFSNYIELDKCSSEIEKKLYQMHCYVLLPVKQEHILSN